MVISVTTKDFSKEIKLLLDAGVDIEDARIEVIDLFEASKDEVQFNEFINRRIKGEPSAYIIGRKPFYKSEFNVIPGVLIPRSDTEILVESALKFLRCLSFPMGDVINVPDTHIPHNDEAIRVIDLCTGSGCIGISVHKELIENKRRVKTTLLDISKEAISCSKSNIEGISDIEVVYGDCLDVSLITNVFGENEADIIVSNPPYINARDMALLDKTVGEFEPELALFGGNDGMKFYSKIALEAMSVLKHGGSLMVEHGYDQGEPVREVFTSIGFTNVMTLKDYGNNDRVTIGIKE